MKSAKDCVRTNDSGPLNRARDRSIFVQRPVRSYVVVIASIGSQAPAQMRLAQEDEMVHRLAPDRSDQPFGKAILPRRGRCSRLVPHAGGARSACDDGAVDPIPIKNEVLRGIILTRCRLGSQLPICAASRKPLIEPGRPLLMRRGPDDAWPNPDSGRGHAHIRPRTNAGGLHSLPSSSRR
jgi:hypothetical protein